METGTPIKKCKSYKYLPYILQSRIVDQCLHISTVLGAVMKCKQYSEITVQCGEDRHCLPFFSGSCNGHKNP